jgi:hypothetical protein
MSQRVTFLVDEKTFKTFKERCEREGRTMSFYFRRWMRETTGGQQLTLDDAMPKTRTRKATK